MRVFVYLSRLLLMLLISDTSLAQEHKGWLGVAEQLDITKAEADTLGWNAPKGTKVGSVLPGSPAEKVGLKAGDIILSIDSIVPNNSKDAAATIGAKHPGDEVRLQVLSGGHERQLTVTVAEWPKALTDCYQRDNADLSIQGCTTLIEQHGRYSILYRNRADAYLNKGDYDRALADYTESIEIDPKNPLTFNARGYAYHSKGDYEHAIADYSKAIEINPKLTFAYRYLGNAYEAKGEHDRAIANYDKVIEIDPKDAWAYHGRGYAYYSKGDYDRAIADYSKAIEIDPNDAWAYHSRGYAYYSKRDYDRAIADNSKAIEIDPKLAEVEARQSEAAPTVTSSTTTPTPVAPPLAAPAGPKHPKKSAKTPDWRIDIWK